MSLSSGSSSTSETNEAGLSPKRQEELQKYKDMVSGYKVQNQFLNREILELNKLRQDDQNREQELLQTCIKLEANYYTEHRKYLACLKELGKSTDEDPKSVEILQRLLEDAMSSRRQWSSEESSREKQERTRYRMVLCLIIY